MNQEIEFLKKLAEAYTTYDASVVEHYLSDDVHYASFWVFEELKSKTEYLNYLRGKLDTMKRTNKHYSFTIVKGGMHENALLVGDGKSAFVVDFDGNGKVKMINLTLPEFC